MIEIWKAIPGYENSHKVSNLGRILSLQRVNSKSKELMPERIMKPFLSNKGYQMITLRKDGIKKGFLVHRLVLRAFSGEPEGNQQSRHLDGNPLNNRLDNLAWGSPVQNQLDRLAHEMGQVQTKG